MGLLAGGCAPLSSQLPLLHPLLSHTPQQPVAGTAQGVQQAEQQLEAARAAVPRHQLERSVPPPAKRTQQRQRQLLQQADGEPEGPAPGHEADGAQSGSGVQDPVPDASTPGDVAARVAKATFLFLTFIYSLTSLLDMSGEVGHVR